MKKYIYIILPVFIFMSCKKTTEQETGLSIGLPEYPETDTVHQLDTYFGTVISDPFRWLEDDTSKATADWVDLQNDVTFSYLNQMPHRDMLSKRYKEIWDYAKYSAPFKKGNYYYYYKNDGVQNQSVFYKGLEPFDGEAFIDPNTFSADGTSSLAGMSFNKENTLLAYAISAAGSDWRTIKIKDIETGEDLEDEINWTKFGSPSWFKDGFYYSAYDEPLKGLEFSQQSQFMKIYYHKLGTPQSEDILIYENPQAAQQYFWPSVDKDNQLLVISISQGTSGNEIRYTKINDNGSIDKIEVAYPGFKNNYNFLGSNEGQLLFRTDENASNYRVISYNPETKTTLEILPQSDHVLQGSSLVGHYLLNTYLQNASSKIERFDLISGNSEKIDLPVVGSVSGFGGNKEDKNVYFTLASYLTPGDIYQYEVKNNKLSLLKQSEFKVDLSDYETTQVFYPSKDGTKIPMFLVHKKGLKMNGNNPVMLYGYGGFNISLTPSFQLSLIPFIENGGIYAMANLRGGGEFGEDWHQAGMLDRKQNVFDDFISAAEFLINNGYTNNQKIAISGRSNGGLLVGACMTQRPDLFKVALPGVGVLDMLRFHKFTVGWGWVVEYGSAENQAQFNTLISYSPLHNVNQGVEYPATLITTADHDDRVVPAHSFKFAAELQRKHKNDQNPVLIRIDKNAGHGAGKPTDMIIKELTDIWSFVFYHLEMKNEK
jgi:prolyl oligopeptidase